MQEEVLRLIVAMAILRSDTKHFWLLRDIKQRVTDEINAKYVIGEFLIDVREVFGLIQVTLFTNHCNELITTIVSVVKPPNE